VVEEDAAESGSASDANQVEMGGSVRHTTAVGDAGFGFAACRGAYDLAEEDRRRSEYLAARAREVAPEERLDPLHCETCHAVLPENGKAAQCKTCRNREHMRALRASRPGPKRGPTLDTRTCPICSERFVYLQKSNRRRYCDECAGHTYKWRRVRLARLARPEAA
jgi:hypothetical protein